MTTGSASRTSSTTASYQKTKRDHANETAEDYVEAIADLIEETGSCRVTMLARRMGVSHVTTSRILRRLATEGLVKTAPYRPVALTPDGRRLAGRARQRHKTVLEFLLSIGVPSESASRDAEGIEHHCSTATLKAMERHTKGRRR
jgi:DtxR family manganese transport transcriptional regulator